jgi:hypothetical protein
LRRNYFRCAQDLINLEARLITTTWQGGKRKGGATAKRIPGAFLPPRPRHFINYLWIRLILPVYQL